MARAIRLSVDVKFEEKFCHVATVVTINVPCYIISLKQRQTRVTMFSVVTITLNNFFGLSQYIIKTKLCS